MTATTSLVPFSPVPAKQMAIPFRGHGNEGPWSALTFAACPLRVLWEENYRLAALELVYGDEAKAREFARRGIAMEDAYIARISTEARPVAA